MDRKVTATKRDRNGNIVALCNEGQSWSPRAKSDVIKDISSNRQSYYVEEAAKRSYIRVLSSSSIESTKDEKHVNHLDRLPLGR